MLTLRPSRGKTLLLLAIAVGFLIAGTLIIRSGEAAAGWFVTAVFGLTGAAFVVHLLPGASYLRLTRQGLYCRSLYRRPWFLEWAKVTEFRVATAGYRNLVFFEDARSGNPRMLPDTYGMKADALAELLNRWREANR